MSDLPRDFMVHVSTAERDAIAQVVGKADALGLDDYERDLLSRLLTKIDFLAAASGSVSPDPSSHGPKGLQKDAT